MKLKLDTLARFWMLCLICSLHNGCSSTISSIPVYSYQIIRSYPHDPDAFTQGLLFADGYLYESTGLYGQSSLRQVHLETGKVLQQYNLASQWFGEGIALADNKLFQLTWHAGTAFVYDHKLQLRQQMSYRGEGWGLTQNGRYFIMSNGSDRLSFRDLKTFQEIYQLPVKMQQQPIVRLNELEFIDGQIYANIWHSNRIAIISPKDGQLQAWLDLTGLSTAISHADVLNGIAYDVENKRLFVTGKRWPRVFEIKIVKPPAV